MKKVEGKTTTKGCFQETIRFTKGAMKLEYRLKKKKTDGTLAAPQGFEPRYADPESAVLPLNEGAEVCGWTGVVRQPLLILWF